MVFSCITLSSNSQTIDYVTGNIVQPTVAGTGTTPWTGGVYQDNLTCWGGGDPGYCGPNAIVRPGNYINFSYGSTYLYQQQNVANLLPNDMGPVKVTGYNFSFTAKNGNGWDDGRTDQLTALVRFWDATGGRGATNLLYGTSWDLSSNFNWTNFNYNENLPTPLDAKAIGQVQYGFIGRDNNGWAGPYGPEIMNVSFSLKYSVDPCATNPAYSSSCAGFSSVLTSPNLVPNPSGSAGWGNSINNSFAIQTALQHSGTGLTVHGFNYGYNVYAAQSYCALEIIWCLDWRSGGSAQVNVGISNATGQNIYAATRQYNESGWTPQSFQYRFPTSINQTQLGTFSFTAYTSGDASVSGMYANMVYGQDPCFFNSNYSTQCTNKPAVTTTTATAPTSSQTYGTTSINVGGVELSTSGEISAPTGLPPTPTGTQTASSDTSAASTVVVSPTITTVSSTGQSTTTSSSSVAQVQQQSSNKAGPNMTLVMSTISKVQAADKATQNAAVANAQQVVATSSAKAQEQANQVVEQANALSAESSQASQTIAASVMQQGSVQQQGGGAGPSSLQGHVATSMQSLNTMAQQSSAGSTASYGLSVTGAVTETAVIQSQGSQGLPLQQAQQAQVIQPVMPAYQPPVVTTTESSSMYSLTAGAMIRPSQGINLNSQVPVTVSIVTPQMLQSRQEFKFETQREQEQPQVFQQPQTAMTRGTILNDIIEQRLNVGSFQMEQQMDTVKKNVLPNELAGGVDLAAMALVPRGYETYSIVTLRDAPFYKSEAIYKDNKTIDNARVLRGLTGGSDALHQRMVDSQYK